MVEGSISYIAVSAAIWLTMALGAATGVWAAEYIIRRILHALGLGSRSPRRTGAVEKQLQFSIAACGGVAIGVVAGEASSAGSWVQIGVAVCVGIVIGRMIQLNADIARKIPPLPNRFPDAKR